MMVRTRVVAAVGAAVAVGVVAFASTAASQNARPAADDPNNASLTYWYWGEDDAPGANGWLKKQVAALREGASQGQDHGRHAIDRHADVGLHDRGADEERA